MSDLRANLDQLHISDDGAERIRQNLKMEMAAEAIVSWCRESIRQANVIIGQGKNMYVCVHPTYTFTHINTLSACYSLQLPTAHDLVRFDPSGSVLSGS